MRARLHSMRSGQTYRFLAIPKMAENMDRLVANNGGEIIERDQRSFGVILAVRKK